jgi:hypothetical protein
MGYDRDRDGVRAALGPDLNLFAGKEALVDVG